MNRTIPLLLLLTMPVVAVSYELAKRPFEENVARSDLVVIGIAISAQHEIPSDTSGRQFVTISVKNVLKGAVGSNLELLVTPEEVEFDPRCCKVGAIYLLLLRKIAVGQYETVNGYHGAQKVDPEVPSR